MNAALFGEKTTTAVPMPIKVPQESQKKWRRIRGEPIDLVNILNGLNVKTVS